MPVGGSLQCGEQQPLAADAGMTSARDCKGLEDWSRSTDQAGLLPDTLYTPAWKMTQRCKYCIRALILLRAVAVGTWKGRLLLEVQTFSNVFMGNILSF